MAEKTKIRGDNLAEEALSSFYTSRLRTFSENIKLVKERREHIRRCVTALAVKKPFDLLSTQEILQACQMSRGSLYYYIRSKEDIRSLIQEHIAKGYINVYQSLLAIMEQKSASNVLRQAIRIFVKWTDDYQDELIIALHGVVYARKEQREPQLNAERRNIEVLESIILKGIQTGDFKTDRPKMIAHTIYLGIRAWADRRWYLRRFYSLKQYTVQITEMALALLKTENSADTPE
jgi:TetR/AcrR family transcriptional regulator, cholesterol catabolism regulator